MFGNLDKDIMGLANVYALPQLLRGAPWTIPNISVLILLNLIAEIILNPICACGWK
jgi:hypothetical protein